MSKNLKTIKIGIDKIISVLFLLWIALCVVVYGNLEASFAMSVFAMAFWVVIGYVLYRILKGVNGIFFSLFEKEGD